jgi:hypothetical protein
VVGCRAERGQKRQTNQARCGRARSASAQRLLNGCSVFALSRPPVSHHSLCLFSLVTWNTEEATLPPRPRKATWTFFLRRFVRVSDSNKGGTCPNSKADRPSMPKSDAKAISLIEGWGAAGRRTFFRLSASRRVVNRGPAKNTTTLHHIQQPTRWRQYTSPYPRMPRRPTRTQMARPLWGGETSRGC